MRALIDAIRHPHSHPWGLRPWKRHSFVLLVAGAVYVGLGLTYFITEPSSTRAASLEVAVSIAPLSAWGIAWIGAGILALISSRWPPASETWGYSALSGLAAWWASCYAVGVVVGEAPAQSASGAFVWALVAFLWWAIAGLWNPDPNLVRLAPDDGEGQ